MLHLLTECSHLSNIAQRSRSPPNLITGGNDEDIPHQNYWLLNLHYIAVLYILLIYLLIHFTLRFTLVSTLLNFQGTNSWGFQVCCLQLFKQNRSHSMFCTKIWKPEQCANIFFSSFPPGISRWTSLVLVAFIHLASWYDPQIDNLFWHLPEGPSHPAEAHSECHSGKSWLEKVINTKRTNTIGFVLEHPPFFLVG